MAGFGRTSTKGRSWGDHRGHGERTGIRFHHSRPILAPSAEGHVGQTERQQYGQPRMRFSDLTLASSRLRYPLRLIALDHQGTPLVRRSGISRRNLGARCSRIEWQNLAPVEVGSERNSSPGAPLVFSFRGSKCRHTTKDIAHPRVKNRKTSLFVLTTAHLQFVTSQQDQSRS
jgi:hypothetical protein